MVLREEKGLPHYLSFHYQGSSSYLTVHQLEALSSELDTCLQQICEWIYATLGVYYSPKGLVPLLHHLGFSYKKSKAVPAKTDKFEQEMFLKKIKFFCLVMPFIQSGIHAAIMVRFVKEKSLK